MNLSDELRSPAFWTHLAGLVAIVAGALGKPSLGTVASTAIIAAGGAIAAAYTLGAQIAKLFRHPAAGATAPPSVAPASSTAPAGSVARASSDGWPPV